MHSIDIHSLCAWKKVDAKDALAKARISPLMKKLGVGALAEDLFGRVPDTYVHRGDVALPDGALLDAEGNGVFVIEGSLRSAGPLTFLAYDAYTLLVVTGDLEAAHFQQAVDTQLVVLGATKVAGLLHLAPADAGFALFRGPVTARDLRVEDNGVAMAVPTFARKPKARLRPPEEAPWSPEILAQTGPNPDPADLHPALAAGLPLFAEPKPAKARAPKAPSKEALSKMSVEEVLALGLTGFSAMTFETTVNPNYFQKGAPGQPLGKLTLADAYLEAFPSALCTLSSLKIIMDKDAGRLARMLRTLPRLEALTELVLADSTLKQLPEEVGALPRLERLELRANERLTALPDLSGLTSLRESSLSGNALTELPAWIARLHRLEKLEVREEGVTRWPKALARWKP